MGHTTITTRLAQLVCLVAVLSIAAYTYTNFNSNSDDATATAVTTNKNNTANSDTTESAEKPNNEAVTQTPDEPATTPFAATTVPIQKPETNTQSAPPTPDNTGPKFFNPGPAPTPTPAATPTPQPTPEPTATPISEPGPDTSNTTSEQSATNPSAQTQSQQTQPAPTTPANMAPTPQQNNNQPEPTAPPAAAAPTQLSQPAPTATPVSNYGFNQGNLPNSQTGEQAQGSPNTDTATQTPNQQVQQPTQQPAQQPAQTAPNPTQSTGPTTSIGSAYNTIEEMRSFVFSEVNRLRRENGLAEITLDANVSTLSQDWAQTQAASNRMYHRPADQISAGMPNGWKRWAENVSTGPNVEWAMTGLIRSPQHMANMLDPGLNRIGIGVAVSAQGAVYITQNFGSY